MVRVRMENSDQTQPEQLCRYLGLEIFLRRDQVPVMPCIILACVFGDKNLLDMSLLPIVAAKQEACSLFGIGTLTVGVDLLQNFF